MNGLLETQNSQKNISQIPNNFVHYRERLNSILKDIDSLLNEMKKQKNNELNRIIKEFYRQNYKASTPTDLDQIIKTLFGESVHPNEIFRISKAQQLNCPKEISNTCYQGFNKN